MIFDLLGLDGTSLVERPYEERRSVLEQLDLDGPYWNVTETFEDGEALYRGVCELGLEGVVAKHRLKDLEQPQRLVQVLRDSQVSRARAEEPLAGSPPRPR